MASKGLEADTYVVHDQEQKLTYLVRVMNGKVQSATKYPLWEKCAIPPEGQRVDCEVFNMLKKLVEPNIIRSWNEHQLYQSFLVNPIPSL